MTQFKLAIIANLLCILSVNTFAQTKPGYKLIFNDEFNSTSFDYSKWNQKSYTATHQIISTFVGDGHLSGMTNTIYDLSSGTSLKLNMVEEMPPTSMHGPSTNSCRVDFNNTPVDASGDEVDCQEEYDYTSGFFRSHQEFQYGYFEISCKMPKGVTFWEAFWLYGQNGNGDGTNSNDWYNEIDVFEMHDKFNNAGYTGSTVSTNVHWHQINSAGNSSLAGDFNDDCDGKTPTTIIDNQYHTYGLEWTPNHISWYVDGQRIRVYACHDFTPRHAMHLITNFALRNHTNLDQTNVNYGNNPHPPNTADLTASFDIDHIRVYKKLQVNNYGANGNWSRKNHRRIMADVNGDGLEDIVGFGWSKVHVSLAYLIPVGQTPCSPNGSSTNIAFRKPKVWITDYCHAQNWTTHNHIILLEDVNGDKAKDIVGFSGGGVYVSYANPGAQVFTPAVLKLNTFGSLPTAGGWNMTDHRRMMADVNGDNKADIVGFGWSKVYVATANSAGTGFNTPTVWANDYCAAQGWTIDKHPISLADMDKNGSADIIGFSGAGVRVAKAPSFAQYIAGTHNFSTPTLMVNDFGLDVSAGGWKTQYHIRTTADVNGDNRADVVGFGWSGVYVSLALPSGNYGSPILWKNDFCHSQGWSVSNDVRMLRDINGDGAADIVAFHEDGVQAAIAIKGSGSSVLNEFSETFLWRNYYGKSAVAGGLHPYNHIRTLADVTGDGQYDIVCFVDEGVMVSESSTCFRPLYEREYQFNPNARIAQPSDNKITAIATKESAYKVAPNPTNGITNLIIEDYNSEINYTVQVYNSQGQKLKDIRLNSSETSIDLSKEASGIYFIQIFDGTNVSSLKTIKE